MNVKFKWTTEKKHRLLEVNSRLTAAFKNALDEALEAALILEKRIENQDRFISDYDIEIALDVYGKDEMGDDADNASANDRRPLYYCIDHDHYDQCVNEIPICLDETTNWNFEYFDGEFDDHYIGYAIHALLDLNWSFSDILNIGMIYADVTITHQYCEDLSEGRL